MAPAQSTAAVPPTPARLRSLDSLRGFEMFWLLGGQQIVAALCAGAASGSFAAGLQRPFTHVEWEGFRFYDFIFPRQAVEEPLGPGLSFPVDVDPCGDDHVGRVRRLHRLREAESWIAWGFQPPCTGVGGSGETALARGVLIPRSLV